MNASSQLDLSGIYRYPVFQSRSMVESHHELARTLTPHQLRWGRGEVATELHLRHLQRVSLMLLRYGAEVEVMPTAFSSFTLVQMPLRGRADIQCDGIELSLERGEVAVLSPQQSIRLLWQPGCEQLIMKIPNALLRWAACLGCNASHCPASAELCTTWQERAFKLDAPLIAPWRALLQQVLSLLPLDKDSTTHPAWISQVEQSVASFLLIHQPSVLRGDRARLAGSDSPPAQHGDQHKLALLDQYIHKRLFAPISLEDLARAAGVSPRTLNLLCHRQYGVAPMIHLRNLRLDVARQKLRAQPDTSVTEVAMACGFGHLGRFSAYYKARFGELPRDTSARHH